MLIPRLLTILVGLPALVFLIHLGGMTFSVFALVVSFLCLYEYEILLTLAKRPVQNLSCVVLGTFLAVNQILGGSTAFGIFAVITFILLREMASSAVRYSLDRVALTLLGTLWLGLLPPYMASIRDLNPNGEHFAFLLFISIWIMDSGAYAAGHWLGRRKLSALSPKKTWEGAIAGFLCAMGSSYVFHIFYPGELGLFKALGIGVIISLAGQLSDLAESMIKRALGVKDSGALLPGHGGILDRFDSFLLASPAVYYWLILK